MACRGHCGAVPPAVHSQFGQTAPRCHPQGRRPSLFEFRHRASWPPPARSLCRCSPPPSCQSLAAGRRRDHQFATNLTLSRRQEPGTSAATSANPPSGLGESSWCLLYKTGCSGTGQCRDMAVSGVSLRLPGGGLRGCSVSFTCAKAGGTVRVSGRSVPR